MNPSTASTTAEVDSSAPSRKSRLLWALGATSAAALVLAGCSSNPAPSQSAGASQSEVTEQTMPQVVVASYPLAFLAQAVGGDQVVVEDVAATAGDAHHLELSPTQVQRVGDADIVVYLSGGFQAAMEDAIRVTGADSFDGMTAIPTDQAIAGDPHIWLDPTIAADLGDALATQLSEINPSQADYYEANATSLRASLEEMDADYARVLADCQGETLLTSHEAFGYVAARYGMEQVGVLGVDPDAEPSPARITEIAQIVSDRGITTLFVEPAGAHSHDDEDAHEEEHDEADHDHDEDGDDHGHHHSHEHDTKIAQTLGLKGIDLDPMEVQVDAEQDFLAVMHSNLHALSDGLACAAPVH